MVSWPPRFPLSQHPPRHAWGRQFGEAGGDLCSPSGGFSFAANYLGWMVLTQMEAPSSSPLLYPPHLPSLQLGLNRWRREQRAPACCLQDHSSRGVFIPTQPGARTQAEQVVPGGRGRGREELSWHCLHRGPGLVTEEQPGAGQVVGEMQGIRAPKETE